MIQFRMQRIGRVARLIGGVGFPPELQGREAGEIPFVKVSDLASPENRNGLICAKNYVTSFELERVGARRVPRGATLFPKVGAALLGNARSLTRVECAIDNNLMAVVPRMGDPRFIKFALEIIDMAEISGGGPLPFVGDGQVRDIQLPFPETSTQTSVANYLEVEVARLDKVLATRRLQLSRLDGRESSLLHKHIATPGAASVRVKHLATKVTSGPRGWGNLTGSKGSPFIRIANVPRRGISLTGDGLVYVDVPSGVERERTRTVAGDVLVTITADIGSVGVVDDAMSGGNVSQHIALVRPDRAKCHPGWLAYAIKSPAARQQLDAKSYGGTKAGLGLSDIAELRLPMVECTEQRRVADLIDEAVQDLAVLRGLIVRQITALAERRRALISAAVTGNVNVSTASGIAT